MQRSILFLACVLIATATLPAAAGTVAFLSSEGSLIPVPRNAPDFQSAAAALAEGPTAAERFQQQLTSAIPPGTVVRSVIIRDGVAEVDLAGPGLLSPLPDAVIDAIQEQFLWTADAYGLDARVLFNGQPTSSLRIPSPFVEEAPRTEIFLTSGALAGKRITISPGHGYYWTGSYFTTQRGITCGDHQQEDFRNLELANLLVTYLQADGAIIHHTREPNKNRGNHPLSGKPWWQMCAPFYLYDKGYPRSVYSPITNSIPGDPNYTSSQLDDDRRSRPEASNYDGTDLYLSIHTNAFQGNCYGTSCPTGIEMFVDATQLGGFYSQSLSLGQKSQTAIYAAVRAVYDPAYPCRNNCTPRTNQAFTEIHYPRRPACLLELGFHDSCDTDVPAQKDPVYTSSSMWGFYKGVCDYFGVTPTWDLRSYEVVSHNIPTLVKGGSSFTVSITLRNRGCVWNEQHQFRLGAVGNSDPLATVTRVTVPGNIGPAEMVTFQIPMNAPLTDLAYYTDWRMVQDRFGAWFGPTVAQVVSVDSSPPTSPGPVDDGGPVQASVTRIRASWRQSTDAKAGLAGYFYRVTEKDGPEVLGWTSAGVNTSVTIPLSLVPGRTYQVWVKAVDNFGWETAPVGSAGVTVAQLEPVRVGVAKMLVDGEPVLLQPVVVSAVFGDHYYVQEMDRSSGLRVEGVAPAGPGHRVSLRGLMGSVGGERRLVDAEVVSSPVAGSVPVPVALSGRDLGGTALGPFTAGVSGGVGLNNVGLYVRVWGMVTEVSGTGFRLSDGSVSGGVWVESGTFHRPGVGEFAVVSGISSVRQPGMERQVKVSRDTDIWP